MSEKFQTSKIEGQDQIRQNEAQKPFWQRMKDAINSLAKHWLKLAKKIHKSANILAEKWKDIINNLPKKPALKLKEKTWEYLAKMLWMPELEKVLLETPNEEKRVQASLEWANNLPASILDKIETDYEKWTLGPRDQEDLNNFLKAKPKASQLV